MLLKESGWIRIFTAFQFLFLLSLYVSVCVGFLRAGRYVPLYPGGQLKFGSIQFPLSLAPCVQCIMPSARLYHKVCNRQNSFILSL